MCTKEDGKSLVYEKGGGTQDFLPATEPPPPSQLFRVKRKL